MEERDHGGIIRAREQMTNQAAERLNHRKLSFCRLKVIKKPLKMAAILTILFGGGCCKMAVPGSSNIL